jgi:enterochelin esterase-like enzyme/sugar lactone lactonase YvrE
MKSQKSVSGLQIVSYFLLFLFLANQRALGQETPSTDNYPLTADSLTQPNVARGEIFSFEMTHSSIFPNTHRTISVYVPAEYKADKPACVYISLDGLLFNVSTVFDNLIAKHEMPVTVAIGISSGTVNDSRSGANPRFDRSLEFDSKNDRLAQFILEEVLPEVEQRSTKDSRRIILSKSADDRMIGGSSTGGIGAFTVAWEHPEAFHRVFTAIGTFVGMRGGESYYVEIRKTEPKPIRLYMQDGSHDEWQGSPEMGDWWMSNQTVERALTFAGYDVAHSWGLGTHNTNHAAAIFPDAMRWLWKDWPEPIKSGISQNPVLSSVLEANNSWEIIGTGCLNDVAISPDTQGNIYKWVASSRHVENISNVRPQPVCANESDAKHNAIATGPDGSFYVADQVRHELLHISANQQKLQVVARNITALSLSVQENGVLYWTSEDQRGSGQVWRTFRNGRRELLTTGLREPSGIAFSPDKAWLFVSQRHSRLSINYRVTKQGKLDSAEPFYDLHVPASADGSGANSVWMDINGFAYVATTAGVQIVDRNGRVTAIIPMPEGHPANSLCFGGTGFHTLYVSSGGKVYARKLNTTGIAPWSQATHIPMGSAA